MRAYYNDVDPFCCAWVRNLIKAGVVTQGDVDERPIQDVQASDLSGYDRVHFFCGIAVWDYALNQAGWGGSATRGSATQQIWTGSCPCQPFSCAGSQRGIADERHLWPEFFRLIRECRPDVVLGEQVAGPAALAWYDALCNDMEGAGYAVGAADLCAASCGAPHIRQRLYWVAYSERDGWQGAKHPGAWEGETSGGRRLANEGDAGLRMADSRCSPGRPEQLDEPGQGLRREAGPDDGTGAGERGEAGPMANATTGGLGIDRGPQGDAGHASQREPVGGPTVRDRFRFERTTGAVADADGRQPGDVGVQRGGGLMQQPQDPLAGFWAGADWIQCTDGKARPTRPGLFPLAHGITSRVGKLRAAGNSLCAPVAQAFVEAVMECVP